MQKHQGGKLKGDNYYWVRYYEGDYKHQCRKCPPNPPMGCWIIDGYAWGQRLMYNDEFAPEGWKPQPLPKPFPKPVVNKPPVAKPPTTSSTPKVKPPVTVPNVPVVLPPATPPAPLTPMTATQPEPLPSFPPSVVPDGGPNSGGGGDAGVAPKKSLLRQVGSVVGIGLVAAVILTVARKYP